jgi:hypothetical protein
MKHALVMTALLTVTPAWAGEACVQERVQIETLTQQNAQLLANAAQQMLIRSVAEKKRLEALPQAPPEQPQEPAPAPAPAPAPEPSPAPSPAPQ